MFKLLVFKLKFINYWLCELISLYSSVPLPIWSACSSLKHDLIICATEMQYLQDWGGIRNLCFVSVNTLKFPLEIVENRLFPKYVISVSGKTLELQLHLYRGTLIDDKMCAKYYWCLEEMLSAEVACKTKFDQNFIIVLFHQVASMTICSATFKQEIHLFNRQKFTNQYIHDSDLPLGYK